RAAADFDIRNEVASRGERPLEGERIYPHAVSGVRFLNHEKDWDGVQRVLQAAAQEAGAVRSSKDQAVAKTRVLQAAAQEAGAVRSSKDQAVAKTRVPYAVAGLAATDSVAPAGPHLQFM